MRFFTTIVSFILMTNTLFGSDTILWYPAKSVNQLRKATIILPYKTEGDISKNTLVQLGEDFGEQMDNHFNPIINNNSASWEIGNHFCTSVTPLFNNVLFSSQKDLNEQLTCLQIPNSKEDLSNIELAVPPPGDCPLLEALAKDLADPDKGPALNAYLDELLTEGSVRVKAWEAMISSSGLRVNISKLEALSEQISKHASKLDDFKVKFANATEAGKQALFNKVDVFFGFKPGKFSEDIVAIAKGSRPDPSTYLTPSYISEHLNKFNGGVTKIVAQAPTGTVGPPGGTFILPKSYADDLISQSNGSVSKLEELLGLDAGYLGSSPVRVNVNSPSGLRMPSGNELGANEFWVPGGKTSGGVLEATVDLIQPGTYTVNSVF